MSLRVADRRRVTLTARDRLLPLEANAASGGSALSTLLGSGNARAALTALGAGELGPLGGSGIAQWEAAFEPSSLSKVKGWLRRPALADGSLVTAYESVLDPAYPAIQTVSARRPVAGTSPSGVGMSTFGANSALVWPLYAGNNQTSKFWIRFWMRQPTSGLETLFCIFNGTNGSLARKMIFQINTTQRLLFGVYDAGAGLRQAMTNTGAFAAGAWVWVAAIFNGTLSGDARISLQIGGVTPALNYSGAGTPPATLNATTGNAIFGNLNDGTASTPFNGSKGNNIYTGEDDLTSSEDENLRDFEAAA